MTRRRACAKVAYPTRGAALHVLRRRLGVGRGELHAYRCGRHTRETWHLTSRARRRSR